MKALPHAIAFGLVVKGKILVSLVGRGGWAAAGSTGRWVDTGMNLRVRTPQIEAPRTAQLSPMQGASC